MRRSSGFFGSLKNKITSSNPDKKKTEPSPFVAAPPTRRPAPGTMNPFSSAPRDPPPAYTRLDVPQSTSRAPSIGSSSILTSTDDDPYAFLSTFDTLFLIDDSGSMAGRNWREVKQCLEAITPVCVDHDKDGIDIAFLNRRDTVS